MPRAAAAQEAWTVGKVLNEAQRSVAGHKKCAAALWRLAARDPAETLLQLCDCLRHVLPIGQREPHVERIIRFVAFAPSQPPAAAEAAALDLTEGLLAFLLGASAAADRAVRFRACQLMGAIFTSLPDVQLTDELVDGIEAAMLQRLRDKAPAVRAEAAVVLARLAQPDEDGSFAEDEVTAALLRLLASDSNKEVRKAVVGALAPDIGTTLPAIINRTRDVEPEVRRMTYRILIEKEGILDMLSPTQRALLLRRGLADRYPRALLGQWLQEAEGSALELLSLLDVAADEGAAQAALGALIAGGALDPVELASEAAQDGGGLRACGGGGGGGELLTPQDALLWRIVCEWLSAEGEERGAAAAAGSGAAAARESAAASDAIEALEAALPPTVGDLLAAAAAHADAGPGHMFAARQLLRIAARCTDMADAASRAAAMDTLERLLAQPHLWAQQQPSLNPGQDGDAAASFGGGSWAAAVYASPAEMAAAMLGAIAGVLRGSRCAGADEAAGADGAADDAAAGALGLEEASWLHALHVAAVLLGGLEDVSPRGSLGFGAAAGSSSQLEVRDLPQALLLPAMEHGPTVRREALRCVGLYCLLRCEDAASLAAPLALLRSGVAAEPDAAAGAAAAAALCDAAMAWGVRAVDGQLPQAHAGDAAAADAADAPVVDLLLAALDATLEQEGLGADDEAAADRAALAATAATGLVKLLVAGAADPDSGLEHGDMVKVLARLLPLAFDPATEPAPALRQALSVGLEAFAGVGPAATRALAAAFLPAARRGIGLGLRRGQAPNLLLFMAQLLQVKQAATYVDADCGLEFLAAAISYEVAHRCPPCAAAKPYVAALCKVLAVLPLRPGAETLPALGLAARQVSDRVAADGIAVKDAKTFAARVDKAQRAGGAATAAEPLDADAVAAMLEAVSIQDGGRELLGAWPLPFEGDAAAPTPRRARKAAPAAAESSESDEDQRATPDAQAPAARRRAMPSRSARKPSYTEPIVESSASEDEAGSSGSGDDGGSGAASGDENEAAPTAAAAELPPAAAAAKASRGGRRRLSMPPSPHAAAPPESPCSASSGDSEAESSDGEENVPPDAAAGPPHGKRAGKAAGTGAAVAVGSSRRRRVLQGVS